VPKHSIRSVGIDTLYLNRVAVMPQASGRKLPVERCFRKTGTKNLLSFHYYENSEGLLDYESSSSTLNIQRPICQTVTDAIPHLESADLYSILGARAVGFGKERATTVMGLDFVGA